MTSGLSIIPDDILICIVTLALEILCIVNSRTFSLSPPPPPSHIPQIGRTSSQLSSSVDKMIEHGITPLSTIGTHADGIEVDTSWTRYKVSTNIEILTRYRNFNKWTTASKTEPEAILPTHPVSTENTSKLLVHLPAPRPLSNFPRKSSLHYNLLLPSHLWLLRCPTSCLYYCFTAGEN